MVEINALDKSKGSCWLMYGMYSCQELMGQFEYTGGNFSALLGTTSPFSCNNMYFIWNLYKASDKYVSNHEVHKDSVGLLVVQAKLNEFSLV